MNPTNFGVFEVDDMEGQAVRFDQATATVAFIGLAKSTSTLTSEAKWRIGRSVTSEDGDVTVEWADEGDYTQIWDNRLTIDFPTDLGTITPTSGSTSETLVFATTTVDTAFSTFPVTAGNDLDEATVIIDVDATNSARVEVSLDGGTTVSTKMISGGFFSINPADIQQIKVKGNEVGILYYVTLIRKKS